MVNIGLNSQDTVIKKVLSVDNDNVVYIWDSGHSDFVDGADEKLYHVVVDTPYRETTHKLMSEKMIFETYGINVSVADNCLNCLHRTIDKTIDKPKHICTNSCFLFEIKDPEHHKCHKYFKIR